MKMEKEKVYLNIDKSWNWTCPYCKTLNTVIDVHEIEEVQCSACRKDYEVDEVED